MHCFFTSVWGDWQRMLTFAENIPAMKRGKDICESLKQIRREIAQANEIEYNPAECLHEGDCAGTCPRCEREMRWLEGQLRLRKSLGKAVTVAGLSLGLASLVSCSDTTQSTAGVIDDSCDSSVVVDGAERLEGDVPADTAFIHPMAEPQEIDGVTQPEDPNDNRDCPPK